MQYAGRVELCPCLTITSPNIHYLIGTINLAEQFPEQSRYYNGLVKNLNDGYGSLQHICMFQKHPAAHLRIATTFYWDKDREILQVRSQYKFELEIQTFSQKELQFTGINAPLRYSHKSIKKWLQRFFDEAGCSFSGWHRVCSISAELSHSDKNGHKEGHNCNSRILRITIWRELGSGKWPD
jgi:hypothetical protein